MPILKNHVTVEVNSEEGDPVKSTNQQTNFNYETKNTIRFSSKGTQRQYFVRAENILIPNSYYNILTGVNDTLSVTEINPNTSYTVVIDEGNYDINSFITEFKQEINLLSARTFDAVFNQSQGKLIISYTGATDSVTFNDSGSTLFKVLGLTDGVNHNFTVASPLLAQNTSILRRTKYLNIHVSKGFSLNNHYKKNGRSNVLTRVPIISDPFTDNFFPNDNSNNIFQIDPISDITIFRIELRDERGVLVDLNGETWQFDLVFYEYR